MKDSDTSRHSPRLDTDRGRTTNQELPPDQARQSHVVLKGPRQRMIFLAGIVGAIIVAGIIALAMV